MFITIRNHFSIKNGHLMTIALLALSFTSNFSNVEAMLVAEAVLSERVLGPQADPGEENTPPLRNPQGWEKRLFDAPGFQQTSPKSTLQWKSGPNLSLKDPGRLPGIELGVEMHSFQAFQSVIPEENLPKGIQNNRERPLLVPPSGNAPDYNGGFLRFTW